MEPSPRGVEWEQEAPGWQRLAPSSPGVCWSPAGSLLPSPRGLPTVIPSDLLGSAGRLPAEAKVSLLGSKAKARCLSARGGQSSSRLPGLGISATEHQQGWGGRQQPSTGSLQEVATQLHRGRSSRTAVFPTHGHSDDRRRQVSCWQVQRHPLKANRPASGGSAHREAWGATARNTRSRTPLRTQVHLVPWTATARFRGQNHHVKFVMENFICNWNKISLANNQTPQCTESEAEQSWSRLITVSSYLGWKDC